MHKICALKHCQLQQSRGVESHDGMIVCADTERTRQTFIMDCCKVFHLHTCMSVHRKYISKVRPTSCNVFLIYLFL